MYLIKVPRKQVIVNRLLREDSRQASNKTVNDKQRAQAINLTATIDTGIQRLCINYTYFPSIMYIKK